MAEDEPPACNGPLQGRRLARSPGRDPATMSAGVPTGIGTGVLLAFPARNSRAWGTTALGVEEGIMRGTRRGTLPDHHQHTGG